LIEVKALAFRLSQCVCVQRPPFRHRTPDQLCAQAREWRNAATQEASADTANRLLRMADRYEALAAAHEEAYAPC